MLPTQEARGALVKVSVGSGHYILKRHGATDEEDRIREAVAKEEKQKEVMADRLGADFLKTGQVRYSSN